MHPQTTALAIIYGSLIFLCFCTATIFCNSCQRYFYSMQSEDPESTSTSTHLTPRRMQILGRDRWAPFVLLESLVTHKPELPHRCHDIFSLVFPDAWQNSSHPHTSKQASSVRGSKAGPEHLWMTAVLHRGQDVLSVCFILHTDESKAWKVLLHCSFDFFRLYCNWNPNVHCL